MLQRRRRACSFIMRLIEWTLQHPRCYCIWSCNSTASKSLLHFSRTSLPSDNVFQELTSLFKNFIVFWQLFPRAYFTFQELHCLFSKSLLHFSRTSLPSWRRRRKLHTFSIGHLTFWRTRAWYWCRHTSAHEAESLVFLPQSFSAITDSEYSTKHDVL